MPSEIVDVEQAALAAQELLARGEPLQAYNTIQAALETSPAHVRLRQLRGLALARSGDIEGANALLDTLAREGHADAETLGMLARTHKDLGIAKRDREHLAAARKLYGDAFESACRDGADDAALYVGINAATVAVVLGERDAAKRIAGEVQKICSRAAPGYWREATLGEASLLLGDMEAARRHYTSAATAARGAWGDIATTRRQARLLSEHLPDVRFEDIDAALRLPPVLVFTGNMIDAPDRATARFPPSLEAAVENELRRRIAAIAPAAAYGAAACGADILCLEMVRELGRETHVVLPFPPDEFCTTSVAFAGPGWVDRFRRCLDGATSVTIASDHRASGSRATFEYANTIHTGMGILRARTLDTKVRGLAVWDAAAGGLPGGAASLVAAWERRGIEVEHVKLAALRGDSNVSAADDVEPNAPHHVRAMLFADAVGYSQLGEDQIPRFVEGFLGSVAKLPRHFEHVETAGDGLYMVFENVEIAGLYALELSALARNIDRVALGLPSNFDLRIALHCGPVHVLRDPITGARLFTGPHTSRAARIEPITPPGQVYASGAFAAVAAASGVESFRLQYVGRLPLAKKYGTIALYCVRPRVHSA